MNIYIPIWLIIVIGVPAAIGVIACFIAIGYLAWFGWKLLTIDYRHR